VFTQPFSFSGSDDAARLIDVPVTSVCLGPVTRESARHRSKFGYFSLNRSDRL
jgi:hypothetical protein